MWLLSLQKSKQFILESLISTCFKWPFQANFLSFTTQKFSRFQKTQSYQSHFKNDSSNWKCNYLIRMSYRLYTTYGNYAKGSKWIFIKDSGKKYIFFVRRTKQGLYLQVTKFTVLWTLTSCNPHPTNAINTHHPTHPIKGKPCHLISL